MIENGTKTMFKAKSNPSSGKLAIARHILMLSALVGLCACASYPTKERQSKPTTTSAPDSTRSDLTAAAGEAAVQPLRDFGMVRKKIPAALARIGDPYAPPTGDSCQWITYEIRELDEALKGEVVSPAGPDNRSLQAKGGSMAKSSATEAVRGVGSMLIPQRGLIRMLSGASKSDRLYEEAEQRGMVRRGYLRGLADSKGC
jgi:hypothetical protein